MKIDGSTIMEVLAAMIILIIPFVILSFIYVNSQTSSNFDYLNAVNLYSTIKQYIIESDNTRNEDIEVDGYFITIRVNQMSPEKKDLINLKIQVFKNKVKILSREEIICIGSQL